MPKPTSHRSSRFEQAARNERQRLDRKRSKISKKREDVQAKLDALDAELEAVDQEIVVLDNLAGGDPAATTLELAPDSQAGNVLKGADIRVRAIPLLMQAQGTAPIHYREWLSLLETEGFQVAGKRTDAVFLNQIARSPVVRATTKAGYYQLDPEAPEQLRAQLRHQQAELSELLNEAPTDSGSFERHRERQRQLHSAVAKTERELDEALSVVASWSAAEAPQARRAA
ncbi:MAG TPA: hypothetical protein VLL27_03505 [Solirubrobacterales bacterium]|nr:hypothetical protein [Solirubrobacterales bacterium]